MQDSSSSSIATIEQVWRGRGLTVTPALQEAWQTIFSTFDTACADSTGHTWAIPLPTGAGKSTCVSVWAARTPASSLIIVPRKEQQLELYTLANELAGGEVMRIHNSATPIEPAAMKSVQHLVITHAAYKRAALRKTTKQEWTYWEHFTRTDTGYRDAIIVDEMLDMVVTRDLEMSSLQRLATLGANTPLGERFRDVFAWVSYLSGFISDTFPQHQRRLKEQGVSLDAHIVNTPSAATGVSTQRLKEVMQSLPGVELKVHVDTSKTERELRTDIENTLRALIYYAENTGYVERGAIRGAFDSVPPGSTRSLVVLDATCNITHDCYQLAGGATVVQMPTVRNYSNLTIRADHTSTGRASMNPERIAAGLVADIRKLPIGTKVGFIAHKQIESALLSVLDDLTEYQVTHEHWGAVTGSNSLQYCSVLYLIGLPHLPPHLFRSLVLAHAPIERFTTPEDAIKAQDFVLTGIPDAQWAARLGFTPPADLGVYRHLQRQTLLSDVIQALNRGPSRRAVDEYGGCPPCEVRITDNMGLSAYLAQEHPGCTLAFDWSLDPDAPTPRSTAIGVLHGLLAASATDITTEALREHAENQAVRKALQFAVWGADLLKERTKGTSGLALRATIEEHLPPDWDGRYKRSRQIDILYTLLERGWVARRRKSKRGRATQYLHLPETHRTEHQYYPPTEQEQGLRERALTCF